jgi:hypothetical protein
MSPILHAAGLAKSQSTVYTEYGYNTVEVLDRTEHLEVVSGIQIAVILFLLVLFCLFFLLSREDEQVRIETLGECIPRFRLLTLYIYGELIIYKRDLTLQHLKNNASTNKKAFTISKIHHP